MTEKEIDEIMKKKSWTGDELGKLYFKTMADMYSQIITGNNTSKSIIPDDYFINLYKQLEDTEKQSCDKYFSVYRWISGNLAEFKSATYQAYFKYSQISDYTKCAMLHEDLYSYISDMPIIISETTLQEKAEITKQKTFFNSDGSERVFTFPQLILQGIYYYAKNYESDKKKDAELNKQIEKTRDIVEITRLKEQLSHNPLILLEDRYKSELVDSEYITSKEGAGLTKWGVVTVPSIIKTCYPNAFTKDGNSDELVDFMNQFSDLVYEVMDNTNVTTGISRFCPAPVSEWHNKKHSISIKVLYDNNVFGSKTRIDSPSFILQDNDRCITNGVIVANKNEPEPINSISFATLEGFFPDSEYLQNNINTLSIHKTGLITSYYFLKAFNHILKTIGEVYNVKEDMLAFQRDDDIKKIEDCFDFYNQSVNILKERVCNIIYPDHEMQDKKLTVIETYFQPIDYKAIKLSKEFSSLAELLKDTNIFTKTEYHLNWLLSLCNCPNKYIETV